MFHYKATQLALAPFVDWTFAIDADLYVQFLTVFYRLFGVSLFLGEQLSVLVFALSLPPLVRLMDLAAVSRWRGTIILAYGLLPSLVIYCSVTQRETFQVTFALWSCVAIIRLRERKTIRRFIAVVVTAAGLALSHKGLALYALFLIGVSLYWATAEHRRILGWKRMAALIAAVFLGLFWIRFTRKLGDVIEALATGRILDYAAGYRRMLVETWDTRANYGIMLDSSSLVAAAASIGKMFAYYMLAPFPWQIGNALDVYAACETALRVLLIASALRSWRRADGELRSRIAFLLLLYVAMEAVWAIGTVNWGTAMRHHLPAYGLLLVIGAPRLLSAVHSAVAYVFAPPQPLHDRVTAG
jgi:hypothetical protein